METHEEDLGVVPSAAISGAELWMSQVGKYFGRLSEELVQKIFEFAVVPDEEVTITTHSESSAAGDIIDDVPVKAQEKKFHVQKIIQPVQVCPKSNKFVWGTYKVDDKGRRVSTEVQKLAAPALMSTCRQFYRLLNESAAFYRLNTFEFGSARDVTTYLASITEPRINDIQNIAYPICTSRLDELHDVFVLLSRNENLDNVTMILRGFSVKWDRIRHPHITAAISKLRCKNLHIKITCLSVRAFCALTGGSWNVQVSSEMLEAHRVSLESALSAEWGSLTKGQPVRLPDQALVQARQNTGVLIHGNGRLNGEAKPDIVSSRTRAGLARQSMFNSDGIIEIKEKKEKFTDSGHLNWTWHIILNHREISDSETSQKLPEFLVEWTLPISQRVGATSRTSWETLEVLVSDPRGLRNISLYWDGRQLWKTFDGLEVLYDAVVEFRKDEDSKMDPRGTNNWFARYVAGQMRKREKHLAREAKEEAAKAKALAKKAKQAEKGKAAKQIAGQKRKRIE